eukprot:m.205549 g.205549  ORF g.205549 m.205549 type:complete len:113 (-) comp16898_c4_seq2:82-420(-)
MRYMPHKITASMHPSIKQAISQSIHQYINQSIDISINPSINISRGGMQIKLQNCPQSWTRKDGDVKAAEHEGGAVIILGSDCKDEEYTPDDVDQASNIFSYMNCIHSISSSG